MDLNEKKLKAAAKAREWYAKNKERAKNNYKTWALKNTEIRKEYLCAWRESKKEHVRKYHRNWMRANKISEQTFPLDLVSWLETFKVDTKLLDGFPCLFDPAINAAFNYCILHQSIEIPPFNRVSSFHNNLRKKAEKGGIRLFTIFEDEWIFRKDQVKNFLKAALKRESINLGARKCFLRELSSEIAEAFIEKHHIQGSRRGAIYRIGIFNGDELLGVMTLNRHHRDASQTILDRLCFKDGVNVQGGSSRLFSKCLEYCRNAGISNLISWSDNRWSLGKVYEFLGFTLDDELPPAYSYVNLSDPTYRISKQSQKKKNTACPKNLTEREWSLQNNLYRVWDCGKKKWVKAVV
jgi:predicted GNAT family N-acyltransferase